MKHMSNEKPKTSTEEPLHVGDMCVVKEGLYKGVIVKIIKVPGKKDDNRYGVSRDGYPGLRFERKKTCQDR
jgi:hypothetical protein